MKTLENLKIVQEFLYQRNHRKMKRQIQKHKHELEAKWNVSKFNVA